MWICARCGTEARQPEVCSGCGSLMKPFPEPPKKPPQYQFVLIVQLEDKSSAAYGPFDSVMAADSWQDAHFKRVTSQVVLMQSPDVSEPS